MQHRIQTNPLALLILKPLYQRLIQFSRSCTRVTLKSAQHLWRYDGQRIRVFLVDFFQRQLCQSGWHSLYFKISMGSIRTFNPVKLFVGVLVSDRKFIPETRSRLTALYGTIDHESPVIPFDFTDYYRAEM